MNETAEATPTKVGNSLTVVKAEVENTEKATETEEDESETVARELAEDLKNGESVKPTDPKHSTDILDDVFGDIPDIDIW